MRFSLPRRSLHPKVRRPYRGPIRPTTNRDRRPPYLRRCHRRDGSRSSNSSGSRRSETREYTVFRDTPMISATSAGESPAMSAKTIASRGSSSSSSSATASVRPSSKRSSVGELPQLGLQCLRIVTFARPLPLDPHGGLGGEQRDRDGRDQQAAQSSSARVVVAERTRRPTRGGPRRRGSRSPRPGAHGTGGRARPHERGCG